MIEVRNLTKTYGKKQNAFQALKDVSFTIPDGASVAILGKSGSGKSTLMHAMSGLDRPEKGEVIINGRNILKLKQKQIDSFRSKQMSFIFQSFFVQANETCYDNVSLPLEIAGVSPRRRRAKIEAALRAVELLDKKKSRARDLSGGQKQRLAIARAIVNEPKILFADEPTGNLDSAASTEILQFLRRSVDEFGQTIVMVTHEPSAAAFADRVLFLADGRIVGELLDPTAAKVLEAMAAHDPAQRVT